MKLGIAQVHTRAGDLAGTVGRILAQAELAAARGVDLLVFPLPTLVGLSPVPAPFQHEFYADVWEALVSLNDRLRCACLVPLAFEGEGDIVCDAALLGAGDVRMLRVVGPEDDPTSPLRLWHAGKRICLVFSYDSLTTLADAGSYDLVICLSDLEFAVDDAVLAPSVATGPHMALLAAMAEAWVAIVAPVGGYGSRVFMGGSCLFAPDGCLAGLGAFCEEDLVLIDLDADELPSGLAPVPLDVRYSLWQALTMGVRDHLAASDASDVVLALDGTMSAAALAVLACDALGPTHVHALADAACAQEGAVRELVDALHLSLDVVDLGELWDGAGMPDAVAPMSPDLMRLTLAARARSLGAIALSALDKTAIALSDDVLPVMPPAFMPLADVLRTDLLAAARLRNAISPVFPSLALADGDVPTALGDDSDLRGEALLACVDDAISAIVAGDAGAWELIDPAVAAAVLPRMQERLCHPLMSGGLLVMSSCTLYEASLPMDLGWRPRLRSLRDSSWDLPTSGAQAAPTASTGDAASGELDDETHVAPSPQEIEGALRETLDLLRDMSLSDVDGWRPPFSEN